jgi:hypothetical protein
MWDHIPREIFDEVKTIRKFTAKKGKEAGITLCKKPGRERLFVSTDVKGTSGYITDPFVCDRTFGKSIRIGDFHTHPWTPDGMGIIPSNTDFTGTLEDTRQNGHPQISCITSPKAKNMICYEPKHIPDRQQIHEYRVNLQRNLETSNESFFIDRIGEDFNFRFFDAKHGKGQDKPSPDDIARDALGGRADVFRQTINPLQRGKFCQLVQSYTLPHNDKVADRCEVELRKKTIGSIFK